MLTSIKTNSFAGSKSKELGMMYFRVAIILFGAQLLFGLVAAFQFIFPGLLFEVLDFSVARMVHINALVVWMLYAMIGSVYYMLPDETGIETVGIGIGKLAFWVLTAAVTVVVLVFIFIQVGSGTEASIWFINEGREYLEAPRWADIGIVVVVVYIVVQVGPAKESTIWLINEGREYVEAPRWADIGIAVVLIVFLANVYLTAMKGERTGIVTVLMADMIALVGLYPSSNRTCKRNDNLVYQ